MKKHRTLLKTGECVRVKAKRADLFSRHPLSPRQRGNSYMIVQQQDICEVQLADGQFKDGTAFEEATVRVRSFSLLAGSVKKGRPRIRGSSNNHHCFHLRCRDIELEIDESLEVR